MAPPTNAELARREAAVRRALEDLDPDGLTPAVLRDRKRFPKFYPYSFRDRRTPIHPTLVLLRTPHDLNCRDGIVMCVVVRGA